MPGPSAFGRVALLALLVGLAAAAVLAWVQWPAPGLYGYDGPFHIRYSAWLREHGISRTFPWWQETFLRDHWADKDFLYHLLLIPFTFGDLSSGGKAASILFGAALYGSLFLSSRWIGARAPAIWTLALLISSTTLLYRAGLLRSHVLAISIALLGTAAILRGHRLGTGLASAAYASTHIAWHLLPGIALVHDLVSAAVERRRPRWVSTLSSLAGTAAAIVLSPFLPSNLRLWYVQNVEVLAMSWRPGAPDLGLGLEILPGRPRDLLVYNLGPALFTAIGLWFSLGRPPEDAGTGASRRPAVFTLGFTTILFLALSFASRRFVEFWAPLSMLFAAAAVSLRPPARIPRLAAAGLIALSAGLAAYNLGQTRRIISDDPGNVFAACATWIRDHVPEGETVFTTDWDEFPDLFFVAPHQRYLVGLDPTFMYVTDAARWRLWRDIVDGRAADIYGPIRDTFRCRWVFADAGHEVFVERADQDPMFRAELSDPDCEVYSLRDPEPASSAAGTAAVLGAWRAEGRAPAEASPGGFVDVQRLMGSDAAPGDCARLQTDLIVPAPGPLTLAVSTDDTIQVAVDGDVVFDSAAAAPPSLDEVLEQHRAGERRRFEHSFGVTARPGYNPLTVSTCRRGRVWGFTLRILEPKP